ncbi:MAG: FAD-binding oxidoreductase [Candidatus Hodarchaeales archaeon]|jgi:D-lactate dehydrogenase (cytochrome)
MTEETPSLKINAIPSPKVPFDVVLKLEGMEKIQKTQAAYLTDESRYGEGKADVIFFPQNEAEVAAVIAEANRQGTPVTIAGARTGLAGGAAPRGGVILSLERMNALLDLSYNESDKRWLLTAQPGVSLEEIREIIESKKGDQLRSKSPQALERFLQESAYYFYPPDPTEMTAWLGGTVATNASGAASFKYGPTRHWINRLRIVLANGEILDIKRGVHVASPGRSFQIQWTDGSETEIVLPSYSMPLCKNAAGLYIEPHMDLIDLFIGSEGILGVITEIEAILEPKPELMALVVFFPGEEEAIGFVEAIRSSDVDPDLLEYFLAAYQFHHSHPKAKRLFS